MPTPSSNASDPPSPPRSHPFSSCPDPEEGPQQQASQQPASNESASGWRTRSPPVYPAERDEGGRTNLAGSRDSRSVTMSPGPHSDSAAREPEGMVVVRGDVAEGQKPADTDEDVNSVGDEFMRGGGGGAGRADGVAAGSREEARTALSGMQARRTSRSEQLSPVVGELHEPDVWGTVGNGPRWVEDSGLVGLGLEYSHMRVIPTAPSLYLQPGSQFVGTQQSERQQYEVEVEIKHVDMRESFLCGYLKIQGLTDDHPTLTTYFEGEIIGSKYGFITQHQGWGASEKIDISHWSKFTAFRPYLKQARKGGQTIIKDVDQRENIFMRWKEQFLVPDHRVRTINGASFEGFYYICFNQVRGEVSGIYFHSKSEKFQQLELKHVDNMGCFGAMEFR
ncbi:hypothetical protein NEMBOFW57_007184 [Staphylotrichum longicolle]|uniref:Vacuolar import and degradation protein n=1 Tax=Staphylotrichum longicolle TaxID=669026 RepID=A0AAD4HY75_9PEZI|nr:hypothetical protein NEMBOFW57_007184 [Staphylotrichum longicolle]